MLRSLPDAAAPPRAGAYTVRDTPEVVRRVGRDLARVAAEVRRADPRLKALVLTGGFARGEGAVLGGQPQNDYDLLALRGLGPAREPHERVAARLAGELGLAIDLQPVWVGRLGRVRPTIFWLETALRGRVLWGDAALLGRIRVRDPGALERTEGLRLLCNRAAGLLLAQVQGDAAWRRMQAAKALLAALDARLLAAGRFGPSQRERWAAFEAWASGGAAPPALQQNRGWLAWAFQVKVDPERAPPRPEPEAWRVAAEGLLDTVPVALAHAGLPSLEAYARADAPLENARYRAQAGRVPGARRWALHPTGRVRVAALAMLAERLGRAPDGAGARALAPLLRPVPEGPDAVLALERLRGVTAP